MSGIKYIKRVIRQSDPEIFMVNPNDIYSIIGFGLSMTNSVEKMLKFVTTFVIGEGESMDWDRLQSVQASIRKKTAGQFIKMLQDRAQLHPSLADLLSGYLSKRNDFIHNQSDIPGWDLQTEEGRAVAQLYVMGMIRDAYKLMEVFTALSMAWEKQAGITMLPTVRDPEADALFASIDRKHGHLLNEYFTKTHS